MNRTLALLIIAFADICCMAQPDTMLSIHSCIGDTCKMISQKATVMMRSDTLFIDYKYVNVYKLPNNVGIEFPSESFPVDSTKLTDGCLDVYSKIGYKETKFIYRKCDNFEFLYNSLADSTGYMFSHCASVHAKRHGHLMQCLD